MNITICRKSAIAGLIVGVVFTAFIGVGYVLMARADLTQAIVAQAKCDPNGWVIITFPDSSQFSCTQPQDRPPTSREEAARRGRR